MTRARPSTTETSLSLLSSVVTLYNPPLWLSWASSCALFQVSCCLVACQLGSSSRRSNTRQNASALHHQRRRGRLLSSSALSLSLSLNILNTHTHTLIIISSRGKRLTASVTLLTLLTQISRADIQSPPSDGLGLVSRFCNEIVQKKFVCNCAKMANCLNCVLVFAVNMRRL